MTSSYYFRYRILDIISNYHSSIDLYRSNNGMDDLDIQQSNGICPYMASFPASYKADLEVNKVIENTKIRAWEM